MTNTSALVKSRAAKAKNHKWNTSQRFSQGHDLASMSLLPEYDLIRHKIKKSLPVVVWRSESFGKTANDRVHESARRLIQTGRVSSVDEAVERATAAVQKSWGVQLGSETIVEVRP